MTRLFDAEALLDALNSQDLADWLEKQDEYTPASIVEHALETLPTADVAPVRHGKWISGNPICPCCGGDKFKDLDADIWADWQPKYCPNCGAMMDK